MASSKIRFMLVLSRLVTEMKRYFIGRVINEWAQSATTASDT
jgi:hypothetical protein